MKILIVEDDPNISDVLMRGLREHGYDADAALDGEEGLALALQGDYDLLILDIRVPGVSGNEICRIVRARGLSTPILMLSALSSPADTSRSMELGADSYLVKPFDFFTLLERIRSLTGREEVNTTATLAIADLFLDLRNQTVEREGVRLPVTAHEFTLLKYLVTNPGRLLTPEMICAYVWNTTFDPRSNIVDVLVRVLQRKIDAGRERPLIETIPGEGYRFNEE